MSFSGKRIIAINDLETMNSYLKIAYDCTIVHEQKLKDEKMKCLRLHSYIFESRTEIKLTTRWIDDKPATYVFQKTGRSKVIVNPMNCYRTLMMYGKIRNIAEEMPELFDWYTNYVNGKAEKKLANSAKALLGFNPNFKEGYVYCYDLNSAYASVLQDKVIDTNSMIVNKDFNIKLKENQVGFMIDRDLSMVTKIGTCPDIIFDLIDSPYKRFVDKYYKQKKNAKTEEEKEQAKAMLNYPVGYSQNHNPFFRAYIVHSCNNYIQQFLNKYKDKIVTWNTDAVYSTVRIPEIENNLGKEVGQWKLEYEGMYRQKGINHQKVETNEITYRGIIKEAFDKNFNILENTATNKTFSSKYVFDFNTFQIKEVER